MQNAEWRRVASSWPASFTVAECRNLPSGFSIHHSAFCISRGVSKLKHLESVVPRVHRDDAAVLVYRDAPGVGELARVAAGVAPRLQALAGLLVDALHAVVPELADDQPPVGV